MKAVFLDRDGVINAEVDFLHKIEDLEFIDGAIEGLIKLSEQLPSDTWKLIIVTNQPVLGRGICTEEQFHLFTSQFLKAIEKASKGKARIDGYNYCPHHPTRGKGDYLLYCKCRKPKPGMLLQAAEEHGIDLDHSYMIGDKRSDIIAGQKVGAYSILVETGYGGKGGTGDEVTPDATCKDLREAAELVISRT